MPGKPNKTERKNWVKVRPLDSAKGVGRDIHPPYVDMPAPKTASLPRDVEEQLVAQTEILMTKGVRSPTQLMALLQVPNITKMKRTIHKVYARWDIYGSPNEVRRIRGESLSRLDLIESEIWQTVESVDDHRIKQVAFRNLLEVTRQRSELHGLSARRIDLFLTQTGGVSNERLVQHAQLMAVAQQLGALIKNRLVEGPREEPEFIDEEGATVDGELVDAVAEEGN